MDFRFIILNDKEEKDEVLVIARLAKQTSLAMEMFKMLLIPNLYLHIYTVLGEFELMIVAN